MFPIDKGEQDDAESGADSKSEVVPFVESHAEIVIHDNGGETTDEKDD